MSEIGAREKLWVILTGQKPRMILVGQFYNFDEISFGVDATDDEPSSFDFRPEEVAHLETMAMTLHNFGLSVGGVGFGALFQTAREGAETHTSAHLLERALVGHVSDDRFFG